MTVKELKRILSSRDDNSQILLDITNHEKPTKVVDFHIYEKAGKLIIAPEVVM